MSDQLPQPPNAVSGDDAGGDEASTLDAEFNKAIQVIDSRGCLKVHIKLPRLAHSGLSAAPVGDVALPLQETQARQIISRAKRFSRATSPWVLHPDQYWLDSGVWGGRLGAICGNLAPALGRDMHWAASASARIHTVLLLEKGMTVDYTLLPAGHEQFLIYLPSADFQGMEILAKADDGQEKTVFNPNKTEQCFASWYLRPRPQLVKSGYALVVAYSLVAVTTTLPAATPIWRNETRAMRYILKRWIIQDIGSREKNALYHPLECDYEKRELCFSRLSKQDAGRLHALRKISERLPFKLYLGHIECDEKKLGNSDEFEDIEGGTRISKLLDLEGDLVCEDLHLDKAHVPEGFFKGIRWESEKQNDSSLIRKGHMSFFVLVPGNGMVPFFIQRGGGGDNEDLAREQISKVLGENARLCVSKHPSINTVSVFEELCTLVWGYPGESSEGAAKSLFSEQKPKFQNSDLADVLKATVQLRWYPWFEKIAAAHEGSLPTSFFGWVPETFHKATLKIEKWFGPLEKGLSAAVLSYPRAEQQVRAVETLFPIIMADSGRLISQPPKCLIRWARQVLQECLKTFGSKKLDRKDGEALVRLSLYFEDPVAVILQIGNEIDPGRQPDAYLGFMSQIHLFGRHDWISSEKAKELYREASRTFITSEAFEQMRGQEKDGRTPAEFFGRLGVYVLDAPGPRNRMAQFRAPMGPFGNPMGQFGNPMGQFRDPMGQFRDPIGQFRNPMGQFGDADYEAMAAVDIEDFMEYMPDGDYMPDGIDSDMYILDEPDLDSDEPGSDLDEPSVMNQFGLGVRGYHSHHHRAYRAYQGSEVNGGRPETEVVENQVQPAALGHWLQQIMKTSTKYDDTFSLALSKMGEVAPQILGADFHNLWFPALKGIAPNMMRLCLERFKDPNTVLWRKNVYTLFKAYLDTYVGQWPRRPGLAQKGVECDCADCKGLNVFLADPSLKTGHFVASKKRCLHLVKVTNAGGADVYTECKEIEGQSKEEKLIVTKSRTKMLSRARTAWKERRGEATKQLGIFEQKHLAALLGPEWMTLFSMVQLGGPCLSDMDMRLALKLKTRRENPRREPARVDGSTSITMFFGGRPGMSMNAAGM